MVILLVEYVYYKTPYELQNFAIKNYHHRENK